MVFSRFRRLVGSNNTLRGQMVRGGAGSALVQAIHQLLALALAIILTQGLGAEGYGIYSYAMALMALLMVPAALGMPRLLLREIAAAEGRKDWQRLRGVLVRGTQIAFVSAVCVAIFASFVFWFLKNGMTTNQVITFTFALLALPFITMISTVAGALRGLQQVVRGLVAEALARPLLMVLGASAMFALRPDMRLPENVMVVQLIASLATLGLAAVLLYRALPKAARSASPACGTRQLLARALPFTLLSGLGVINNQTDILMLGILRPVEEVGVYRVAVQGASLVAFGLHAANVVIAPQFAKMYAQGDVARLQRLVTVSARLILLTALPIVLVLMLAGGVIAGWVFGPDFVGAHAPLALLAVGQLVSAAMGSVGILLNMTGHETVTARILIMTGVLNVVMNLALIPQFGMIGAAASTALSLALWNILCYRAVKARIGIRTTAF